MTYIVKSVTNNQYTVKVVNQNGSLLQAPTTVPTVTTSAISDLAVYATTEYMLANDATTYANAVTYVTSKSYVNTSQLSANLTNYQTSAGLSSNVATLTSNNSLYLGSTLASDYQTTAGLSANIVTLTANNTSFVGSISAANVVSNAQLQSNLTNYQTTVDLSANVAKLTANNANYLGTVAAASYVNTSGAYTITGIHTYNANVTFGSISAIIANGVFGTTGQVLTSNGTGMYWSAVSGGGSVNTAAQYIWSNTQTFSNTITFSQTINGIANNSLYLGGIAAASYVNTSQLSSNLTLYQTTAGLSANVATLTANNTSFVGSISAANVVSNAQLQANLTNYQTTAGLSANVAKLDANNALYLGGIVAASYVNSAQLSSNLTNYQTTTGLSANVAKLDANNTIYLGGANLATIQTQFTSNDATTYSNATTFASNATNISSGTLNAARLPYQLNQNLTTANSVTFNSVSLTTGTVSTAPSTGNDIVNKTYADAIATGVNFHPAVKLTTTVSFDSSTATYYNGTSGVGATITDNSPYIALSLDGVTAAFNDRILMKNSTNTAWNGIYTVSNTGSGSYPWVLSRSYDYDQIGAGVNEIDQGDLIYVTGGSTLAGSSWVQQQVVATIGTDPITFVQFSSKALYTLTNGSGLYYSVGGAYDGSAAATLAVDTTYIGTLTANNSLYLGGVVAASYVNSAQLSSNLTNYQTTAGLSANVATLTANAAGFLGNSSGTIANVASWITGNSSTAYTNAIAIASNATNLTNGTLPDARLSSAVVNTSGNFTISGNLNHTGTNNYFSQTLYVGANVVVNTTTVAVGNSTVYANITAGQISVSGATINATNYSGTANNANNLGGQPNTYFTNATNMSTGTLPDARLSSAVVNTSGNYTIAGNLNFTGSNNYFSALYAGANVAVNATTLFVGNATINTSITTGQISLSGVTIDSTSYGGSANNASYLGTVPAASYVNTSGNYTLAGNLNFTGTNNYFSALYTGANVTINTSTVFVGNATVNTSITGGQISISGITVNSTIYQGTANNANNLGGQLGSYYTNATNITTGTLPYAQLGSAVVNTSAAFTLAGDITFSANLSSTGWLNIESYSETKASPTITTNTLTLDLAAASVFDVSLNSAITTLAISNTPATANKTTGFVLIFTADGTARSVSWPAAVKWANNSPPTITSTNAKKDVFVFFTTDNGTSYNGFISGQNI